MCYWKKTIIETDHNFIGVYLLFWSHSLVPQTLEVERQPFFWFDLFVVRSVVEFEDACLLMKQFHEDEDCFHDEHEKMNSNSPDDLTLLSRQMPTLIPLTLPPFQQSWLHPVCSWLVLGLWHAFFNVILGNLKRTNKPDFLGKLWHSKCQHHEWLQIRSHLWPNHKN